MFATLGIVAALIHRMGGGTGQIVDVSLMESCFALMEGALPEYELNGTIRGPSGTSLKGIAPSNIFRSRDGTWVVIAANNDNLFGRLVTVMERPDLIEDERFATHLARGVHQEELDAIIADWALQHDWREIYDLLNDSGVVCGPIYTIADIVQDEHYAARDMFIEHDDPEIGSFRTPGVVPKFSATPGAVRWSGPAELGAHTEEVLRDVLGMSAERVQALRSGRVV